MKFKLTAIIRDKKGRVLSIGKNSYIKTHPLMLKISRRIGIFDSKKNFIHAEIDAITKCDNLKKAYSIEIYRFNKDKTKYLTSKPCIICRTAIEHTNIKIIRYVDKNNNWIDEYIK